MDEEKTLDFYAVEWFFKIEEPSDVIPLPDGLIITKDVWYRISISKK